MKPPGPAITERYDIERRLGEGTFAVTIQLSFQLSEEQVEESFTYVIRSDPLTLDIRSGLPFAFVHLENGGHASKSLGDTVGKVPTGQWTHFALVKKVNWETGRGTMTYYWNGEPVGTTSIDHRHAKTLGVVRLGGTYRTPFRGLYDDLRVYPFARSADEIAADGQR